MKKETAFGTNSRKFGSKLLQHNQIHIVKSNNK